MELEPSYKIITVTGDELGRRGYKSLVLASWMKALRHGNDFFKLAKPGPFYRGYGDFIEKLLAEKGSHVRLAVLSDDEDVVLGYAAHRGNVLDFWYVKKDYRMIGIGARVMPPQIKTVTHVTKTWLLIWSKDKYKEIEFNPFA